MAGTAHGTGRRSVRQVEASGHLRLPIYIRTGSTDDVRRLIRSPSVKKDAIPPCSVHGTAGSSMWISDLTTVQ